MGIFDTVVRRFVPEDTEQKIPHMGWNALTRLKGPLFAGIPEGSYAYFVHSYYAPVSAFSVAECNYVIPFSAALNKGNFYATQFHVEKSGTVGMRILENFLSL